jgi:hypothetical protein
MGGRSGMVQSIYISIAYRAAFAKIIRNARTDLLELAAAQVYHGETICARRPAQ